jgi:hypothetical protein
MIVRSFLVCQLNINIRRDGKGLMWFPKQLILISLLISKLECGPCSFNCNIFNSTGYTVLMTVNDELVRMWKEAVVADFKIQSQNLPGKRTKL